MTLINGYIHFKGNTREAMAFYQECFGGDLEIQTIAGSPIEEHMPPEARQGVLHSALTNGGVLLMASDMVLDGLVTGNNMSLMVTCESEEEIDRLFAKLSEGGSIMCPLGDSFWGSKFGHLTDKFEIRWGLNYEKAAK
ncbi:VOC family protein [Capsulimonas corticalis]|uniref:VOC family protein n=1 Tax=Capsulimonas corticalis TaxID=2219043 RepID=A0A402CR63_9BACT|nr:VOC family protein [Capsulimonas corticalis]BDI34538.1 VOC family protein [Capsulimonas corticalis]